DRLVVACAARPSFPDGADNGDCLANLQTVDRLELAVIVITARVEIQQIPDRLYTQTDEPFGRRGAHAPERGDRTRQPLGVRLLDRDWPGFGRCHSRLGDGRRGRFLRGCSFGPGGGSCRLLAAQPRLTLA